MKTFFLSKILRGILFVFFLRCFVSTAFAITPNAVELEIAQQLINHPDQQRAEMVYDSTLNMLARYKALDMATRNYVGHVDPDGYGPNKALSLAGYGIPAFWGDDNDANFVESIGVAYATATDAVNGWVNSASHLDHVLGQASFFAGQTRYGIGYVNVPGSTFQRYYVFVSAPVSTGGDKVVEPYAEWLFEHFTTSGIDNASDSSDDDANGIPRIVEFALGFDPKVNNQLPKPIPNRVAQQLRWTLPFQNSLGNVQVFVERSTNLSSWSTSGVSQNGQIYSISLANSAFMRVRAVRNF